MLLLCVVFSSVFTSYSFMVDHAGDLSSGNFAVGPLYICASIGGGCGFFYLGKQTVAVAWPHSMPDPVTRVAGAMLNKSSLMTCLVTLVGVTTLRAALGPHGFVRYVMALVFDKRQGEVGQRDVCIVAVIRTTRSSLDHGM